MLIEHTPDRYIRRETRSGRIYRSPYRRRRHDDRLPHRARPQALVAVVGAVTKAALAQPLLHCQLIGNFHSSQARKSALIIMFV
jgi:hypothetical protein